MSTVKTVLFVCGSFNPPTNMHLRMFELARDHMLKLGYFVCGGVMSPVHDKYGKKDLISSTQRCEMIKLAIESSSWIKLSEWESKQIDWTPTRLALKHHEDELNQHYSSCKSKKSESNSKRARHDKELSLTNQSVRVMLLCGTDVLESMAVPGLWKTEDIEQIAGHHGIVVVTRGATNPAKFIYENDILSKYMDKIFVVNEWITNEISSSNIRRALKRGDSVKYLINERVEQYIREHCLYSALESPHTHVPSIVNLLSNINNNYIQSTSIINNDDNDNNNSTTQSTTTIINQRASFKSKPKKFTKQRKKPSIKIACQ